MISWRILSRRLTLPSKDLKTGIASQKIDWHCLLWWGWVGVTHAAVPTGILRSLTLVRDDRLGVEIPKQQCCHPDRAPYMSSQQSPFHVIPAEPLTCHPNRAPFMSSRQSPLTVIPTERSDEGSQYQSLTCVRKNRSRDPDISPKLSRCTCNFSP